MSGTLIGAYGRDYKSGEAAIADWNADKDFMLHSPTGGGYINRSQANESGFTHFQIRWMQKTEVTVIEKQADGSWGEPSKPKKKGKKR